MADHPIDAIRAEDAFSSKLGYEEHIPGQTRDWNEELQTTRELPRKNLPERLLRERAIFKVIFFPFKKFIIRLTFFLFLFRSILILLPPLHEEPKPSLTATSWLLILEKSLECKCLSGITFSFLLALTSAITIRNWVAMPPPTLLPRMIFR